MRHKQRKIIETRIDGSVVVDISTPAYPNATTLMDREDFDKIKTSIFVSTGGYPTINIKGKSKRVHQTILTPPKGFEIDHINRDRTDNRRSNLRIATRSQNKMNRTISSNNTSGKAGVYWSKQKNKWQVRIEAKGVQYHLGFFKNKKEAIDAREKGEQKYFGDYAAR